MTDSQAWLTVDDLAEMFGVTRLVIYGMIRRDKIQAVKIGKTYRIHRSEVERLLERDK